MGRERDISDLNLAFLSFASLKYGGSIGDGSVVIVVERPSTDGDLLSLAASASSGGGMSGSNWRSCPLKGVGNEGSWSIKGFLWLTDESDDAGEAGDEYFIVFPVWI